MEMLILAVLRRCSRQLQCFALFAQYFLLNPVVFDQIKSGFLLRGIVFGRYFVTFAIFWWRRRPASVSRAHFVTAGAIDLKLCTYVPLGKSNSQISVQSDSWFGHQGSQNRNHKKSHNS
jgi:hypothetical protein